jgi:ABC-type multidrug transport system ATPase subunit
MLAELQVTELGKRFGRQWLFQNVSVLMQYGKTYALIGNNGSGKSTLLQLIYGYQTPSKGKVNCTIHGRAVAVAEVINYASYVAPYLDLPEELTLEEQLHFHFQFKPLRKGFSIDDVIKTTWLEESRHKKIKHFSSGMKQRVKLAQAFYAETPLLFLDEPCTNLDAKGIAWYREQVQALQSTRLIVIASNQTFEYDFADEQIMVGK